MKYGLFEVGELIVVSLSSRRAWIEIWEKSKQHRGCQVALLAEGVD